MDVTTADTPSGLTDRFQDVWADQKSFNLELRTPAATEAERCALTSDMTLHLIDEVMELLRCVKWKKHRRQNVMLNPAHRREELVDIFKMFMTVAQIWDTTPEELMNAYWEKSAVVRQRHAEEWIRNSQQPSAVIDLDNCLVDFSVGMACWLHNRGYIDARKRQTLIESRPWIDGASAGYTLAEWDIIKHEFNTTGGFRSLPLTPGAKEFTDWCRDVPKLNVVILTSRPIDRYPNILTDTVFSLNHHRISADFVWWGSDKDKKLHNEGVLEHVRFAVDDDKTYVDQFMKAGIQTFWMRPGPLETIHRANAHNTVFAVPSFATIQEVYTRVFQR